MLLLSAVPLAVMLVLSRASLVAVLPLLVLSSAPVFRWKTGVTPSSAAPRSTASAVCCGRAADGRDGGPSALGPSALGRSGGGSERNLTHFAVCTGSFSYLAPMMATKSSLEIDSPSCVEAGAAI